jgi:hypothetical protein
MASISFLESLANPLPQAVKGPILNIVRDGFRSLRFGAPDDEAAPCENFGGHLVPLTTSSSANGEVAVAHKLGRIPRLAFPVLALDTVNATMPVLTVTRAADATYIYLKSSTTSASLHVYVELLVLAAWLPNALA